MTRWSQQYPRELRERAVRMVAEVAPDYDSQWAAIGVVAQKLGIGTAETVRKWVRQAEVDAGQCAGRTSEESARVEEDDHRWAAARRRAGPDRAGLHRRGGEHALVWGHHLHPDRRRVGLHRDRDRSALPQGGGLRRGRPPAYQSDHRGSLRRAVHPQTPERSDLPQ